MLPNSSNPFLLTQGLYQDVFNSQTSGVLKETDFMSPENLNGHIYKANKLKMTKHTGVSKNFGVGDISQEFRSGIHLLSNQRNTHQGNHSKKRRTDEVSPYCCKNPLLTMPSHVPFMQPMLQSNSLFNPTIFNSLNGGNRSNAFVQTQAFNNLARNNGFQQASTNYDGFQFNNSTNNSPIYTGLMNTGPVAKNISLNNASNKVSTTSTVKSSARTCSSDGDYNIVVGEVLRSANENYEVLSFLGRGTFGQVVKCQCRNSNRIVAIKILKNLPSYLRQGNVEIQILQTLSQHDTETNNIVRAIECFQHRKHMCLVFELLEQNLYEFLKSNNFRPLELREIRPIAQQVLTALSKLKSLGLIHADLKPENIMLVCPTDGVMRYRVKVIDFGSACHSSKAIQNTYLQSRYYRAPEILLGLPFNEGIDMWSLGCVIAELFLGWPLYPGSSEYDQIRYIVETQGLPPRDLLKIAGKATRFFVQDSCTFEYRLKNQDDYYKESGQRAKETRKYIFSSLDQIREVTLTASASGGSSGVLDEIDVKLEAEDRIHFTELLIQMLQLRSTDRILPDNALLHSFITMPYLRAFSYRKRVQESIDLMRVCYKSYFEHNQDLANTVQQQHEQALLEEALVNQAASAFAAQHHLLALGGINQRTQAPGYYMTPQQAISSPLFYHHQQQQQQHQHILRPQPPQHQSLYDQLIAVASPYATAVAPPPQVQSHQNSAAAAAAALMMQSAMMVANGASPTKPMSQSVNTSARPVPGCVNGGDSALNALASAAAAAFAASGYANKTTVARDPQYVFPPAPNGVNQKLDYLMSCMSGIMPDSTGCGSVSSQTLQRRQMCQMPENDMTHTLSYPATHQHFLHHPHQHHQNISASMQTQVQQHQHPDIAENNAAAAAVAASQLAALRQLLFNANAQANQQSLLDKFLLQENQQLQQHLQKTGFFSDGGDFNLPSAELYSQLVQLGKQKQPYYYSPNKCQPLYCDDHYHQHQQQEQEHQVATQHVFQSQQHQLQQFTNPQFFPQGSQTFQMSNTTAPISEASNDVAQCVMNLANHILPYTYQRPASSSSSPRADGDGRDGDDSYVHVVDDVKPRPDGSDGNASVVHALHSPPTPTADVVLEMPILAQPSPSLNCTEEEHPETPNILGPRSAKGSLVFVDATNQCELTDSVGGIDQAEVPANVTEDEAVVAAARALARGMDRNRPQIKTYCSLKETPDQLFREPTSLIHRPDKKIPVGRVQPMKKAECEEGACFVQPQAPSLNHGYTQSQNYSQQPQASLFSAPSNATAPYSTSGGLFSPDSAAAAAAAAAILQNSSRAQQQVQASAAMFLVVPTSHHQQQLATNEAYRNLLLLQQRINLSAAAAAQFINAAAAPSLPHGGLSTIPLADSISGDVRNQSLEQLTAEIMAVAAAAAANGRSGDGAGNTNPINDATNTNSRSHYL